MQSLLRELGRNPALLEICGFDPLPYQSGPGDGASRRACGNAPGAGSSTGPSHWNFSRFWGVLCSLRTSRGLVSAMIESLRAALFAALPDFGRHLGYDGKAIASHSTGRVGKDEDKTSGPRRRLGQARDGGVDARTARWWKKVKSWFGYGLHLIADTDYEVPVAFEVTRASASEPKVLSGMLEELFARAPEIAGRCADFSADRGLDDARLKARLWDRVDRPAR